MYYFTDKNAFAKSSVDNEAETGKNDSSQNKNEEIEPVAGPSNPTPIVENINEYELNDDSDDDVVPIYDDPPPIVKDVNEYTFDSDWESGTNECDVNESRPIDKKYFGKNTRNPALTYMLEYSGLTQNQIMHLIINHNNDESHKTTNKNAKTPEKNTRSDLTESKHLTDNKPVSVTLDENCEDRSKVVELQNTQDTRLGKDSSRIIELIPSSPESGNFVEVEPFKDNAETLGFTAASHATSSNNGIIPEKYSTAKSDDVTQIDTSDSGSDDFIEIHDVPIPDVDISRNSAKKNNIEITIKSDENLDDMFADIFEKVDRNEVMSTSCTKQIKSLDTNNKHQTVLVPEDSNNVKKLNTIPEEVITKKTNIELPENIQSIENVLNDESKVHDSQSPDKVTDQNNMNSEVDSSNERVQEKPVVLPTNKEGWVELKVYIIWFFFLFFCKQFSVSLL